MSFPNPQYPTPEPGAIPDLRETVIFIDEPSDPLSDSPSPAMLKLWEEDRENIERYMEYAKQLHEKSIARRPALPDKDGEVRSEME